MKYEIPQNENVSETCLDFVQKIYFEKKSQHNSVC